MTLKTFFNKLANFTRRNLSTMAVSFCMILALSLVTAVAVTKMNKNTATITTTKTTTNTNKSNQTNQTTPETKPDQVVPTSANDIIEFAMPVDGATEGLPFAMDRLVKYKTLNKWQTHSGIDLVAMAGTKVVAVLDGTVESVETTTLWGTIIVLDHGNGLKTTYKSLSSDVDVKAGDKIKKGEQIGVVSTSAKAELDQGAHLHFEVILNGEYQDPYNYLPSGNK